MALSNLASWAGTVSSMAATSCGTACGAGDAPAEPEAAPAACGSACGAGDAPAEAPAACGSACGASAE